MTSAEPQSACRLDRLLHGLNRLVDGSRKQERVRSGPDIIVPGLEDLQPPHDSKSIRPPQSVLICTVKFNTFAPSCHPGQQFWSLPNRERWVHPRCRREILVYEIIQADTVDTDEITSSATFRVEFLPLACPENIQKPTSKMCSGRGRYFPLVETSSPGVDN